VAVYAVLPTRDNVLGILSLIFWSLIIVISIKYIIFVMRADNRGEGGILALMALVLHHFGGTNRQRHRLIMMGLFGATLFYGDGVITPAISVLSAVEGLHLATPVLTPYVIPITVLILVGLFAVQSHGTARVGAFFGPVMLLWFAILALLGLINMMKAPQVLAAFDPEYAMRFFATNRGHGFLVLGAVFLVMTGGEALYADMGHFGKLPIRLAWFTLVLPAILLNYLGQGALLLSNPDAIANPFYLLAPSWALYPHGGAGHDRDGHRLASGDFRGVFHDPAGGATRFLSARIEIRHTSARRNRPDLPVPAANWAIADRP
jgi:KUP system potassium uptake protein